MTPLWQATEETLARGAVPPPFWAFAWAGGQALARYLLDHPRIVAGRACARFRFRLGPRRDRRRQGRRRHVLAAEIDPFAAAAIAANAALNEVAVAVATADLIDTLDPSWDVVTAGDVCYEQPMAGRVTLWLRRLAPRKSLFCSAIPGAPIARPIRFASAPATACRRAANSKTAITATR